MAALLLALAALAAAVVHAQPGDDDFGAGDFDFLGDFDLGPELPIDLDGGDFEPLDPGAGDGESREDPGAYGSDVDEAFETDEILALNLTRVAQKLIQALGFRILEQQRLRTLDLELTRLRVPQGMLLRDAFALLRRTDPAGFFDLNFTYRLAGAGAACEGVRCYGQQLIGWNATPACGMSPRIGLVDSALNLDNPALEESEIVYKRLASGRASVAETEHGTAIASLLVGDADSGFAGLLPQAELIAADVFTLDAKGQLQTDAARLAQGLDWVASHEPAVINLSIAGPPGGVLRTAIRRVAARGIVIVAAAGNLGPAAPPQYPAAYPEVIAVTAVDRKLRVYLQANRGDYVALSAPGVGIWTAGAAGAGVFRAGTSYAAPFATAAVALLREVDPELSMAALRSRLRKQARDLGAPGVDPVYGAGLLQSPPCTES